MKKILIRLSVLAVIAGVGQFSTASAFTSHPDATALQAAPNRGIPPGDDCFRTECGGGAFPGSDFSPLPPGFFDPGSTPFPGTVEFGGGETSGQPDTVVQRPGDPLLQPIPIELVSLSLVSMEPITVTTEGANTPSWDVEAGK